MRDRFADDFIDRRLPCLESCHEMWGSACLGCACRDSCRIWLIRRNRRFCHLDHRFRWILGALFRLGRQGKDDQSIAFALYTTDDFKVYRNSCSEALYIWTLGQQYLPIAQIEQNKPRMCAPRGRSHTSSRWFRDRRTGDMQA